MLTERAASCCALSVATEVVFVEENDVGVDVDADAVDADDDVGMVAEVDSVECLCGRLVWDQCA